MDKRSLVFVFTMFISFFLINQWYSTKNQDKLLKNMQNESSFAQIQSDSSSTWNISTSDIPLTPYYTLEEPKQEVGYGVLYNRCFVSIKTKDAPRQVLVKKGTTSVHMDLIFQSDEGFCYYAENLDVKLTTAFLPQFKQTPVVLVPMSASDKSMVYGSYQNQKISLKSPARQDSIVFIKDGKNLLPIGVYSAQSKKFILFSEYDMFRDFLSFKTASVEELQAEEKFFVLENDYQQVVFSNFGGAIAEINLPFKSANNSSIVLPVSYDRVIETKFPYESSFPVVKAFGVSGKNELVVYKSKVGGYYPLLRRDLLERDGKKAFDLQSRFYACNLIVDGRSASTTPYKMVRVEKDMIEFEGVENGRKISKIYRLSKNDSAPYSIVLTIKVDGSTNGLYLSTGVPEIELISGASMPLLQFAQTKKDQFVVEKVKLPKATFVNNQDMVSYVANTNGYFGLMLSSLNEEVLGYVASFIPGNLVPTRLSVIDSEYNKYPVNNYPGYELMIPLDANKKIYNFAFYAGPIEENVLSQADAGIASLYKNPGFKYAQTYYGFFSFISEPFAKFLFLLMKIFHSFTKSWGISIILLTIALRVMLYPLNNWAMTSTLRSQKYEPQLKALREKYKKDSQRLMSETLRFNREHKINPFASLLPILIQIPFMIGMFDLLKSTFQLRGASFIPGWINNLSAPDVVFSWGYPIPLIGNSFHLLPVLIALVMIWQQKMTMPKIDPKEMTDEQRSQRAMGTFFTLLFPVMFYNSASGLNIYWFFSSLLGIAQQVWLKKFSSGKKES